MTSFIPSPAALLQFNPHPPAVPGSDALKFGMTMWFRVRVQDRGGTTPLGMWSVCGGLGVKLDTEAVPSGIGPDNPLIAPTALKYDEITLERAVSEDDSDRVRSWLEKVVGDWYLAADGSGPDGYLGATVTIELFSALQPVAGGGDNRVASWTLRNAYPVKWTGPTLNAGTSGIAMEKLTLAHSGFLEPGGAPSGSAGAATTGESGIVRLSYQSDALSLQYQPAEMTMRKTVAFKNVSGNQSLDTMLVVDPGKTNFSFTARVEGQTAVVAARDKLFGWLEPVPVVPPAGGHAAPALPAPTRTAGATDQTAADDANRNVATTVPKQLQLRIGTGSDALQKTVLLRSVNTTFKRFTRQGIPSRATFALELEAVEEAPKATNPTSGGPPGTTVHTVAQGDDLARIAQDAYDSPARWRDIAERNGIDDPLRLRVGRQLLLPGSRSQ